MLWRMTIKGPGIQGRETSVQVNRKASFIVRLHCPNSYYWLSLNMLRNTIFNSYRSLSPQLFPTFLPSPRSNSSPPLFFAWQMAEQNLCRLSPCRCPVIQVRLHFPLELQLQNGLSSVTQVWLPPHSTRSGQTWFALSETFSRTPFIPTLSHQISYPSILQLSSQVLLWEAFLDL